MSLPVLWRCCRRVLLEESVDPHALAFPNGFMCHILFPYMFLSVTLMCTSTPDVSCWTFLAFYVMRTTTSRHLWLKMNCLRPVCVSYTIICSICFCCMSKYLTSCWCVHRWECVKSVYGVMLKLFFFFHLQVLSTSKVLVSYFCTLCNSEK